MNGVAVAPVRTEPDIEASIALAHAFFGFARVATGRPDMVDQYLTDHKVEEKFASFEQHYLPPVGECLLARLPDGTAVGTVMLTTITAERCEMNRMFVSDAARGLGVGRQLCEALMARAAGMGFAEMTLDTLKVFTSAVRLYRAMGFVDDTRPGLYDADNPMTLQLRRSLADKAAQV